MYRLAMIPALINNLAGAQMVTGYDADIDKVGAVSVTDLA